MNTGSKILIVEDESIIAMRIEEELEIMGFKSIDIALDRASAEKHISKEKYDLFLLDINLGGRYDGIEIAEMIRKGKDDAPLIFISGNSDALTLSKAKLVRPNAYLLKPFTPQDLKVNVELSLDLLKQRKEEKKNDFSKNFLENHPSLVIRITSDKTITFVNPIITRVSGKNAVDYIDVNIMEAALETDFKDLLQDALQTAAQKKRRFTLEVTLSTVMGERMMFVVGMPELDEKRNLMGVILLLQDITDQKIATDDLLKRNKKIVDSINYSRKIQQALLPTTIKMQKYLPESGIMLMPKDVVSGDFPWVFYNNGYLYAAVVDCTGHGVPGALLSVILHFLLNDSIRSYVNEPPGKILELLHVLIRRTLKQHMPEVDSNDGADIALCRLNLENGELVYSGAHRSLLYIEDGVLTELKGDRQPIGGEQYNKNKKRLTFSNQTITMKDKGKVLIFSDGLTDQFGGSTEQVTKFGINRVKEVLQNSNEHDCHQTLTSLESEILKWKGSYRQMDDILAICFQYSKPKTKN